MSDKQDDPSFAAVQRLAHEHDGLRAENERLRDSLGEVVAFVETFCEECEEPKIRVNVLRRAYAALGRDECGRDKCR